MISTEALEERALIVKHIHNVGDALAKLGIDGARGYHMLALAIEGGAHGGLTRAEVVGQIGETLKTMMPSGES